MTQEIQPTDTQFLLYQTTEGNIRIETRMQNKTVWLTINQMAELFGVDKSGISRHLKKIYQAWRKTSAFRPGFYAMPDK